MRIANGKLRVANGKLQGVILALWLLLVACARSPVVTPEPVRFRVAADSTTTPLAEMLLAVYQTNRPFVTTRLLPVANSATALEALETGRADLAFLSASPDLLSPASSGLTETASLWVTPFAWDGVALITHPDNPVTTLSGGQVQDLFQGHLTSWEGAGGEAQEVVVVSREEGSGTRAFFETLVMGEQRVTLNAVVMAGNQAVVEYVMETPGAVGYVSTAYLQPGVNVLNVEGVPPLPSAIAARRYPLARPLYLVARRPPAGGLGDFVAWVLGEEGQRWIGGGYVALGP